MLATNQIIEHGFIASVTRPGNDISTLTIIVLSDEIKTRRINIEDKAEAWKAGQAVSMGCIQAGNCRHIEPCAWMHPVLPTLYQQVKALHAVFNKQREAYEALDIEVKILDDADIKRANQIRTGSTLSTVFGLSTGVFGLLTLNPWIVGTAAMSVTNGINGDSTIESMNAAIQVRHKHLAREHAKLLNTRQAFIDLLRHSKLALTRLALEESVTA